MNAGVLKGRIYQVLFEHGPMTYGAIRKYIPDIELKNFRACIKNDRCNNKTNGRKCFRIIRYEPTRGKGGSLQPVFTIGTEPDVPPPVLDHPSHNAKRRYDARRKVIEDETIPEEVKEEVLETLIEEQKKPVISVAGNVFANMFAPVAVREIESTGRRVVKQY